MKKFDNSKMPLLPNNLSKISKEIVGEGVNHKMNQIDHHVPNVKHVEYTIIV